MSASLNFFLCRISEIAFSRSLILQDFCLAMLRKGLILPDKNVSESATATSRILLQKKIFKLRLFEHCGQFQTGLKFFSFQREDIDLNIASDGWKNSDTSADYCAILHA